MTQASSSESFAAVVHAYRDEAVPGETRLRVAVRPEEVQLTIEDDGQGLTPRVDSPGLGLPLIAALSERDAGPR